MEQTIIIGIKASELKALSYFAAVKDVRNYLNGIFFDVASTTPVAVATNGHTLAACKLTGGQSNASVIVPIQSVSAILKGIGKRDKNNSVTIIRHEGEWSINFGAAKIGFSPVEGTFPDYNRVIPKDYAEEIAAQYNPEYLMNAQKAAAELECPYSLLQQGDNAGICSFGAPNFIAVIMPWRTRCPNNLGEWHKYA